MAKVRMPRRFGDTIGLVHYHTLLVVVGVVLLGWTSSLNAIGQSSEIALDVIQLSLDVQGPQSQIVIEDQSIKLSCTINATTTKIISIKWLLNNTFLDDSDTRWMIENNGADLVIPKVIAGKKDKNGLSNRSSVLGEYRCLVTNRFGSILSSPGNLQLSFVSVNNRNSSTKIEVNKFQSTVLPCNIHSFPTVEISWKCNNKSLPQDNAKYVVLPMGSLFIRDIDESDLGFYRCSAQVTTTRRSKGIRVVFSSEQSEQHQPPEFLFQNVLEVNETVTIDNNLTLYCIIGGWPSPTIKWFHNDIPLTVNPTNPFVYKILNAAKSDNGKYKCTGANSLGVVSKTFYVQVQIPPTFNIVPSSYAFPSARTIRLGCSASGVPTPQIHWLKNGKPFGTDSRVKFEDDELLFDHTFSSDSGIYQCVATNSAGQIWSASQLVPVNTSIVKPPENAQCRPYDETQICVTWQVPENSTWQGFSVHSFLLDNSTKPPDIGIGNKTYLLVPNLLKSTKYLFYVRMYSKSASDGSNNVSCTTGLIGERNLTLESVNTTTVELNWSRISYDIPCNQNSTNSKVTYKVLWKRKGWTTIWQNITEKLHFTITGLSPSVTYDFKVLSALYELDNSSWFQITLPDTTVADDGDVVNVTNEIYVPAPENLEAIPSSSTSINLTWSDVGKDITSYTVCYAKVNNDEKNCEAGPTIQCELNSIQIVDLEPNTLYEFKVRAHNTNGGYSSFSQACEAQTLSEEPSKVTHLNYTIINETAVCLYWQAPKYKNDKLLSYEVMYTADHNLLLTKWPKTIISTSQFDPHSGCSSEINGTISTILTNVQDNSKSPSTALSLIAFVVATYETGTSKPAVIYINTKNRETIVKEDVNSDAQNAISNKSVGILLGVIVSVICIVSAIGLILVRRHCVKNGQLGIRRRNRNVTTNNGYPAIAHTVGGAVQVRLNHITTAESNEIEYLVPSNSINISSITSTNLDIKGRDLDCTTNYMNGNSKQHMNGGVHITENPSFNTFKFNNYPTNSANVLPIHTSNIEENEPIGSSETDRNCLLQSDEPLVVEIRPKGQIKTQQCNSNCNNLLYGCSRSEENSFKDTDSSMSSTDNGSLNTIQTTIGLDNSFTTPLTNSTNINRRISPILGPNG